MTLLVTVRHCAIERGVVVMTIAMIRIIVTTTRHGQGSASGHDTPRMGPCRRRHGVEPLHHGRIVICIRRRNIRIRTSRRCRGTTVIEFCLECGKSANGQGRFDRTTTSTTTIATGHTDLCVCV